MRWLRTADDEAFPLMDLDCSGVAGNESGFFNCEAATLACLITSKKDMDFCCEALGGGTGIFGIPNAGLTPGILNTANF